MANIYFDPGEQRAAKVNQLFTRIAPRYDLLNDLQSFGLHRRWKRRVLRLARGGPGARALDLCCGTGDLALGLARQGTEVIGLDFSQRMLEVAVRKSTVHSSQSLNSLQSPVSSLQSGDSGGGGPDRSGPRERERLPRRVGTSQTQETEDLRLETGDRIQYPASSIQDRATRSTADLTPGTWPLSAASPFRPPRFVRGDAQRIPFADDCFDIVTVGYGLRNLVSWEAGLQEMQRVARPGGRLVVLDFGKPDNAFWRGLYFGYLRLFVPLLGRVFVGDAGAYAYILESLRHYAAQQVVAARMRALGLANVQVLNLLGGVMSINYAEK